MCIVVVATCFCEGVCVAEAHVMLCDVLVCLFASLRLCLSSTYSMLVWHSSVAETLGYSQLCQDIWQTGLMNEALQLIQVGFGGWSGCWTQVLCIYKS
jgi:hypothetical protein